MSIQGILASSFNAGWPTRDLRKYSASAGGVVTLAESAIDVRTAASVQPALRDLYGKGPPLAPAFGDHPDFAHLRGVETERCGIVTLFMDIEGSTRLNMFFDLEDVYFIKQTILGHALDIVRAFDGHPHRLMGDAVMAFFGGKRKSKEQAAVDALNAASVLLYYMERVVRPALESRGYTEHPLGIRVGMDYGNDENVLWSRYGFAGMSEVTATSFFVDIVPKLQGAAGRNGLMLGESICDFLDVPDELLAVKTETADGSEIARPFVLPNMTRPNGSPMNYRQRSFAWERYLEFGPFGRELNNASKSAIKIRAAVGDAEGSSLTAPLTSASRPIPKGKWIRFDCTLPYSNNGDVKVEFNVENHGRDATRAHDLKNSCTKVCRAQARSVTHWRHTAYRGLHYMIVEAASARGVFAVYVS